MRQNIQQLERQIGDQRARCDELRTMLSHRGGASEQDQLLAELADKVVEVHAACGNDSDHDPETLQMLAAIESTLEVLLAALDEAEERGEGMQLDALEKNKERERRELVRRQRKEQSDRKIEK